MYTFFTLARRNVASPYILLPLLLVSVTGYVYVSGSELLSSLLLLLLVVVLLLLVVVVSSYCVVAVVSSCCRWFLFLLSSFSFSSSFCTLKFTLYCSALKRVMAYEAVWRIRTNPNPNVTIWVQPSNCTAGAARL